MLTRLLLIGVMFFSACGTQQNDAETAQTQHFSDLVGVSYSAQQANGNRLVEGQSDIQQYPPIDIPTPAAVVWLNSIAIDETHSMWSASLSDGQVLAFKVSRDGYESVAIQPSQTTRVHQATLVMDSQQRLFLANGFEDGSSYSGAVILDKQTGSRVYVANNGNLILRRPGEKQQLDIQALNYARPLVDEQKRILLLTGPSLRYDHQVLGSAHSNATRISLVSTEPRFELIKHIEIANDEVFEGNGLIWLDLDGDGEREIISTISTASQGARIQIFNEDGSNYSQSNPIGLSYRWRHQLVVAEFRPQQLELASIYIPHLAPVAEFFRLDDQSMQRQSLNSSYSSHLNISLNLDKSLAGDFDEDGHPELVLMNRNNPAELGFFGFTGTQLQREWNLSLGQALNSNLSATRLDDNRIALGGGHAEGIRIWHP